MGSTRREQCVRTLLGEYRASYGDAAWQLLPYSFEATGSILRLEVNDAEFGAPHLVTGTLSEMVFLAGKYWGPPSEMTLERRCPLG